MCEPVGVTLHRLRASALQPELTCAPYFCPLPAPGDGCFTLIWFCCCYCCFLLCSARLLLVGDEAQQQGGDRAFPTPLAALVLIYTLLYLPQIQFSCMSFSKGK